MAVTGRQPWGCRLATGGFRRHLSSDLPPDSIFWTSRTLSLRFLFPTSSDLHQKDLHTPIAKRSLLYLWTLAASLVLQPPRLPATFTEQKIIKASDIDGGNHRYPRFRVCDSPKSYFCIDASTRVTVSCKTAALNLPINTWHAYIAEYCGFENVSRMYRAGVTWRSNTTQPTIFNCPSTILEIAPLPGKTHLAVL